MRIFNKFVESKKEPSNKNDVWFDGSVFRIYKEEGWRTITLTKEAIDRIVEYSKSLDIYVMVDELPSLGEEGKIYVLQTIEGDNSVELSEYVWKNNSWKLVDNFNSVSLVLDNELSETSHNAIANFVVTNKFKEVDEAIKNNKAREEKVTYAELVALRDAGKLSAGAKYRITDYVATTTQEKTAVISNENADIDVIVTATTPSCLSEEASAILSDRVTNPEVLSHIDYSGWKLWYSLDNNTKRFVWADEINGKGVIYRMIDSFGNDLPFDFYSIQTLSSNGYYYRTLPINLYSKSELFKNNIKGNVIKPAYITNGNVTSQTLNRIILTGILQKDNAHMIGNTFDEGCCDIVVTAPCRNLTFQKNIKNVVVKGDGNALTDTLQNYIFSENINNKTIQCKVNKDVTTFIYQDSDGNVIEMIPGDLPAAINAKQDTLVSGENIKTINGESILGGGNIVIEGGSATPDWNASKNEDGFIKNKPYEIFKSRIEKVDDNTLRVSMAEDEYSGDYSVTGHYIKWSDSLYKLQYDETNLEINGGRDILYVTYDEGYYYLTHSRYDADYILSEFVDYPDSNNIFYVVKGIDATCLKDNVVKTLPQELSNDAKSQALANLGLTDIARKAELTELSEKIENLPSGESSVFEAVYEKTTYEEIVEAYNQGKAVTCRKGQTIAQLYSLIESQATFGVTTATRTYRFICYASNLWNYNDWDNSHSLETLDNGNVQLTIAGKTAEVATPQYVENAIQQSATPSGDPMHYMFEAAGATYNATDADIPMVGVYGDSYVHKAKHWYLNELGDITNEEMRQIYLYANLDNGAKDTSKYLSGIETRTNIATWSSLWNGKIKDQEAFAYADKVIVARMRNKEHYIDSNASFAFIGCRALQKILPTLNATATTSFNGVFEDCNNLREVRIKNVKVAIKFDKSPLISKASILYLIQNSAATSAMVITLHADAYARLAEDADIVAALAEKTNVSLAK